MTHFRRPIMAKNCSHLPWKHRSFHHSEEFIQLKCCGSCARGCVQQARYRTMCIKDQVRAPLLRTRDSTPLAHSALSPKSQHRSSSRDRYRTSRQFLPQLLRSGPSMCPSPSKRQDRLIDVDGVFRICTWRYWCRSRFHHSSDATICCRK